jgi:hypothetical protein
MKPFIHSVRIYLLFMVSSLPRLSQGLIPVVTGGRTSMRLQCTEHSDLITAIDSQRSSITQFQLDFTIYGEPIPLQRHRVARGIMFNPSAKEQKMFLKESEAFIRYSNRHPGPVTYKPKLAPRHKSTPNQPRWALNRSIGSHAILLF